jgi:hypothetical protein
MRWITCFAVGAALVSGATAQIPKDDAVRIGEFYRLASQVQNGIWPGWSDVADPVLLVTPDTEFLTHFPSVPVDFKGGADGFSWRPRKFGTNFEATLPVFGPPAVILIGEPAHTASKTSTPWVIVLMHEHFHQLQDAKPGYWTAVNALGLSHGDQTGMWMLNYPFPYSKADIVQSFSELRDQLIVAVKETDKRGFQREARRYVAMRRNFFATLSSEDHRYLSFQLWQEGIARYTQIKAAEAAASYQPTMEYQTLADYQPFSEYAKQARTQTLDELQHIDIAKAERVAIYSFGAVEGLLLDRLYPDWKSAYFNHMLTTDGLFDLNTR